MKTTRTLIAYATLSASLTLGCVVLGEEPPDVNGGSGGAAGAANGPPPGGATLVCDPNDLEYVFRADGTPETQCFGQQRCVVGLEGEAECGCEREGLRCIYTSPSGRPDLHVPSRVSHAYACPSANADPSHPGNLVEECAPGFMCLDDEDFNDGVAACASSVAEEAQGHPFAEFGCVGFTELFLAPTKLGVDCRCRITEEGAVSRQGKNDDYAWPGGDWPQGPLLACQSEGVQRDGTWRVPAGSGPKFDGWKANGTDRWYAIGMDTAARQLYAAVRHNSPFFARPTSAIVRWDLDTNTREVVTGFYYDPQLGRAEAGSGYATPVDCTPTTSCENPLWGVGSGALGDDGWIYTLASATGEGSSSNVEIVKTRLADGARELVWRSDGSDIEADPAYGQCRRSTPQGGTDKFISVPWVLSSFTRGPDGTFYMAFYDNARAGRGVAALSADGATCTVLSRYGARDGDPNIGAGFEPQFELRGLVWHDGALYAVESNNDLYAIDPDSGDRTKVSYDTASNTALGNQNMFWDTTRDVFWLAGDDQVGMSGAIVDPATGRRESIWADNGFELYGQEAVLQSAYVTTLGVARSIASPSTMVSNGNNHLGGTLALDPDDPDIVWAVITAGRLMKYDLTTFNNYTYSY